MTISPAAVLQGAQRPRLHSVPAYVSSAGQEAIDLAASAGLLLDEWQQLVLRDALGERPDGKWAAFEVGLIVPRQNGKGSVLEALELAGLFLFGAVDGPPPLILHSAHEFKTSAEHFRRMRDLVEGADHLRKRVRIVRTAAGSEAIELVSGARLRFVTRTGGSGRGFSADTIVIDEAYNLTADSIAAVMPTMSARPNPQIWYTSSAGMPSSEQLARLRTRGQSGTASRLAFFEWSAPDDANLDDPMAWAQANPAIGQVRPSSLSLESIAAEREAMPDEHFGRERLGLWADVNREALIDLTLWLSLLDPKSKVATLGGFGFDVAPNSVSASIIAAGLRADGLSHLELIQNEAGTDWCVPRLVALWEKWQTPIVLDPASPAGAFVEPLEAAGVKVVKVSTREYAHACQHFVTEIASLRTRHQGWPALDLAVAAAKKRDIGDGGWGWARKKTTADISPLVAATLALHGMTSAPSVDVLKTIW